MGIEIANDQRSGRQPRLPDTRAAAGFRALLKRVDAIADAFDAKHPNRAVLNDFYDRTEGIDHAVLHALPLPDAKGVTPGSKEQTALIQAHRYLRYIVLQAQLAEPMPRDAPAAAA